MARNPETTWEMLNVAMSHFQVHISSKKDRCSLSIIDLLHVSNFKGGNASITEPVSSLPAKLKHYESGLKKIENAFATKSLVALDVKQRAELKKFCADFLALTNNPESEIRGFGPSYASALLAAHFPDLIPVLDRRALNGAGISVEQNSQGQVKNIATHYSNLIEAFSRELNSNPGMTMRQLDKAWFSKPLTNSSSGRP
jgi:hypothetical protein